MMPFRPSAPPQQRSGHRTAFSATAQREIVSLHGDKCWHCESQDDLEFAHVIARSKGQILTHLQSQGKTNLTTLHDTENGMRLCVTCHHALDNVELPGWVFIPTSLEFFLDAEREDFIRRQREFTRTGQFPIRQCPPVGSYVEYCGKYDTYMLRHYGPPTNNWRLGRSTYLPTSKDWHGDPMLALFKGFNALAYEDLFPPELRELNLLYRRHDALPRQGLTPPNSGNDRGNHQQGPGNADDFPPPAPPPRPDAGQRSRGRGRPPRGSGGRGRSSRQNSRSRKRQLDRPDETPRPQLIKKAPWVWGPHKTANEVGEYLSEQKARIRARIPQSKVRNLKTGESAPRLPSPEETEVPSHNSLGRRDDETAYPGVVQWLSEVEETT
ncbi:MAG: hypothetical protein Q9196_000142 [Gyalolechia fulgens]